MTLLPLRQLRVRHRLEKFRADGHDVLENAPNRRLVGGAWMGVRRAIGVLPRAMTISSPASTLARSFERLVFAAWMVKVDIIRPYASS